MSSDSLESLTQKQKELEEAQCELKRELARVSEAIELRQREALFGSTTELTAKEFLNLRRSLTVLGSALATKEVVGGWVRLVDEDPTPTTPLQKQKQKQKPYNIEIECVMVSGIVIGLAYTVTIRTRSEDVRRIVRAMLISNDMNYFDSETGEEMGPRNTWEIDWDNHYNVRVAHPLSEEEYYAGLRRM